MWKLTTAFLLFKIAASLRIPVPIEEIAATSAPMPSGIIHYPGEVHLQNVRQLTFGGSNAEAYFSNDSKLIIFQAMGSWGAKCDQIYWFDLSKGDMSSMKPHNVTYNVGTTTCSYFKSNSTSTGYTYALFASTYDYEHHTNPQCQIKRCSQNVTQAPPTKSSIHDFEMIDICGNGTYTWDIFPQFDIYQTNIKAPHKYAIPAKLVANPNVYDAEATVSPHFDSIVYTSLKSKDLELWTMNLDGSNPQQVTKDLGYDGGAFFAPDGKRLVFRASRPKTAAEKKMYKLLLKNHLVAPTDMELYLINADGTNQTQLTHLGGANWAPFFHPNNRDIIFSTNHHHPGFLFNLFEIYDNGTCREQITFDPRFDAFPMFSPDGKKLIFSSMRNQSHPHEINLFIADWVPGVRACIPPPTSPLPKSTTPKGGAGSLSSSSFSIGLLSLLFAAALSLRTLA